MAQTDSKKRRILTTATAIILAISLIIGGSTFAYLQSTTDNVVNDFKTNQVSVDLKESSDGKYNIIPGTSEFKDPTVTVNTTIPAYVYVEVTDNTDGLVTYAIEDNWLQLEGYNNIYYREIDGNESEQTFTVLKNNTVSYDTSIVNSNMLVENEDGTFSLKDGITLTFNALAIQKEPFKNAVEAYQVLTNTVPILDGYTTLYEYDLSATANDDVKAYYLVPNKNTSPIDVKSDSNTTANINLLSSFTNLFKPLTAYAAENSIIEYNGIRYELSDEDTLVISGNGEMKENVQADLIDYENIKKDTANHFGVNIITGLINEYIPDEKIAYYISANELNISGIRINHLFYQADDNRIPNEQKNTINEINQYIDTIKNKYVVSLPKSVIINSGVTNISKNAFLNCTSLLSINMPETITAISNNAFKGCTSLDSITLPTGVTNIGECAFYGCSKLKSISLPDSVSTIGMSAFNGCSNLTNITMPKNLKSIDMWAFGNCTSLESIIIPDGIKTLVNGTFQNCTSLKNVVIPNSINTIDFGVFEGCRSLTSIVFPKGVTTIDEYVFANCYNLKSIALPSTVTSISQGTLDNAPSNLIIYCETQKVADLVNSKWKGYATVVDSEMFS